jgi:hypothetical protein
VSRGEPFFQPSKLRVDGSAPCGMLVSLLILIAIDARGKAADRRPEIAAMATPFGHVLKSFYLDPYLSSAYETNTCMACPTPRLGQGQAQ